MTAGSSFLLTSSENWPTIEDGRRSGGDCWRAPPRNTRLDSSRTMGGAQATAPDLKHIGPIDPDASTLNQFLNRWPYARLRMFSWTAERFRLRFLRTAALNAPAGPQAPDTFAELTRQEDERGLLSRADVGFRTEWLQLLKERGVHIVGHELREGGQLSTV